jgi:hypothetical protein
MGNHTYNHHLKEIDGEEEYEVEDILMHRKSGCNQKLQYLVK